MCACQKTATPYCLIYFALVAAQQAANLPKADPRAGAIWSLARHDRNSAAISILDIEKTPLKPREK
jgi:hypothetical protein